MKSCWLIASLSPVAGILVETFKDELKHNEEVHVVTQKEAEMMQP